MLIKNAMVDTVCFTLRFKIPSTAANVFPFQRNVLGESSSWRKNWENFHLLVHTQVHPQRQRSQQPHLTVSHGSIIMDKIRWKILNIYFPHIFLSFFTSIFHVWTISNLATRNFWNRSSRLVTTSIRLAHGGTQLVRPLGAASWAEIGPRFGGLKQASRRVRS